MAPSSTPLSEHNYTFKDPSLFITQGFVAGNWKSAASGKTFNVIEPSSGSVLGTCADFGRQEFLDAIDSAYEGYKKFNVSTTAKEKVSVILPLENGKTLAEAKGEIAYAASFVTWFAEEATRAYGDVIPSSYANTTVLTFKEPVGVCGIITPWNFPAAMITRKVAPALAAGCAVVIKPPSETPYSALALVKLALQAGIPGPGGGDGVVWNTKVKKVSFTGSTGVGKLLTQRAAGTMKKVSMELGGNAPFIVFADGNLDLAVEGALVAKFRSSGQTCVCANRILVQSSAVEEFTKKLVVCVKALNLGKGIENGTTQGPLVNASAVAKVASHVADTLSKGGRLETGGKVPAGLKGYFYEPTVISGATPEMEVAHDETFGPLAAIFSFETEEEALALANDTEFGLASYVYSKDVGRVLRVARALDCGMVGVNTGLMSAAETPFGGVKESGIGREGSRYGIAEYQNIKSVTIGNTQD